MCSCTVISLSNNWEHSHHADWLMQEQKLPGFSGKSKQFFASIIQSGKAVQFAQYNQFLHWKIAFFLGFFFHKKWINIGYIINNAPRSREKNKQTKTTNKTKNEKREEKKKENWKIIPYGYKFFYPREYYSIVPKAVLSLHVRNVGVKAGWHSSAAKAQQLLLHLLLQEETEAIFKMKVKNEWR